MPNIKPENDYGTYGSVPTEKVDGGGGTEMNVKASPEDFGSQIGGAIANAGTQATDVSQKYAQMATETKANDVIVNQYAPAAAQMRSDFDRLDGIAKVQGYDSYIGGLQKLQKQTVGAASSPAEAQILSQWSARHIESEIGGARTAADQAWVQHQGEVNNGVQDLHVQDIANTNNNPVQIDQNLTAIKGLTTLDGLNKGLTSDQIDQQYRATSADAITKAITTSNSQGNTPNTYSLLNNYGPMLDNDRHTFLSTQTDNIAAHQSATNNNDAIEQGKPLPTPFGYHAADTRAAVANAFHDAGLDPNLGLGHLRMESADGTNVGKIGNIGQNITVPKGAPLEDQIAGMVKDAKDAQGAATKVLGRVPTAAENYLVYQQGLAGGPALLKAVQENPNMSAVQALLPAYATSKNPMSMALRAIQNNGGHQGDTAASFVSGIENRYWQKYNAAKITLPGDLPGMPQNSSTTAMTPQTVGAGDASATALNGVRLNQPVVIGTTDNSETPPQRIFDENAQQPNATSSDNVATPSVESVTQRPGDVFTNAYSATNPPMQSSIDPAQQYKNAMAIYNQKMTGFLGDGTAEHPGLPEGQVREASIALARKRMAESKEMYDNWKQSGSMDVMKLVADPSFTGMNDSRITPQMWSFMGSDPQMLIAMQKAADSHVKKEVEVNPTDPAVMQTRGQLLNMKYNSPDDYMKLDLSTFAGKLPSKEIVSNQEEQVKMRNDPEALANQNKDVGAINETVKDLLPTDWRKNKPSDEDAAEAESFKGRLIDEVYKERDANNGKMPGRDEIRKMTVGLLGSYVAGGKDVDVDSHSWTGNNTIHPYQIPAGTDPKDVYVDGSDRQLYIPENYKQTFINSQLALGKNPTEEDMIKSYKDVVGYKERPAQRGFMQQTNTPHYGFI